MEYWVGTFFDKEPYFQAGIKTEITGFDLGIGLEKNKERYQFTGFVGYRGFESMLNPQLSLSIPFTHRERGVGIGIYVGMPLSWNDIQFEPLVGWHLQNKFSCLRSGIRFNF